MSEALPHWNTRALREQLDPLLAGIDVEAVARIGSTNSALLERARAEPAEAAGAPRARLLIADNQTAGRGRLGRSWRAAPGASLTFSLALPLAAPDWSGLSLAVGVAIADAIEPPHGSPAQIGLKWPNDLWIVDPGAVNGIGRKLGGILVETVAAGSRRCAVIGVGINLRALPAGEEVDLANGFASLDEMLPAIDAPQALARIAKPLVLAVQRFEREGFGAFVERFAARDLLRGCTVATSADGAEGIARGVAADGALRIETATATMAVASGEIGLRPPSTAVPTLRVGRPS